MAPVGFSISARPEEAIRAFREDLAICRETGDRYGEGVTLENLALALQQVRRFEEAIDDLQAAAAIFQETGDQNDEARTLNALAAPHVAQAAVPARPSATTPDCCRARPA